MTFDFIRGKEPRKSITSAHQQTEYHVVKLRIIQERETPAIYIIYIYIYIYIIYMYIYDIIVFVLDGHVHVNCPQISVIFRI